MTIESRNGMTLESRLSTSADCSASEAPLYSALAMSLQIAPIVD